MAYKKILVFFFIYFLETSLFGQTDSTNLWRPLEHKVDSVVRHGIENKAFPGCAVLMARGEEIILHKSYGFHTYDSARRVSVSDIYDLASITKVAGGVLALMKLYDDGLLEPDKPLKNYVKGLGFSKIGNATVRECLAHQAGLIRGIKYYECIRKHNGRYRRNTISPQKSPDFPFRVGSSLYAHRDIDNKIKKMIKRAPVDKNPEYLYSGLFFYLVPEIVESLSGQKIDDFLNLHFYGPLGLSTIGYNPLARFEPGRLVPTEIDSFFRHEPIHGTVHDEGAILMGGISGNAGLFGSAGDLYILCQMLLRGGDYQGKSYLKPGTVSFFTSYQYPQKNNRRGLGFDKPLLVYDKDKSTAAKSASSFSYGHGGFTGTLLWVDPMGELIYIFLSNRVYPDRGQKAIYDLNIRPTIHQLLYDHAGLSQ